MDPIGQPGSVQTTFPCEYLYTPGEDKENKARNCVCINVNWIELVELRMIQQQAGSPGEGTNYSYEINGN